MNDLDIIKLFINDNGKICNARFRSRKFLTEDVEKYIKARTSFFPLEFDITKRVIAINFGWKEYPLCAGCNKNHISFSRGKFTKYCGYSCSNKVIAANRLEKHYQLGNINPVKKNIDLFKDGFKENKSIIEICTENNLNYKGAREILETNGIVCPTQYGPKASKGQKEIADFLDSIGLNVVVGHSLNRKEIDIFLPKQSIGIEYNGAFWHNDKIRSKTHLLEKHNLCLDNNIRLLHIWDSEWKTKETICKSIIQSAIKKYDRIIYGRKCVIKEIDSKTYSSFLVNSHIQGARPSSIRYGLFHNDILESVMGFNKHKNGIEMTRFCHRPFTTVIGGAERLFKRFLKDHSNHNIISFSDKRLFTGNTYLKLGFKKDHDSGPNYFYFKPNDYRLYSRQKFQKHKLSRILPKFNDALSEYENMMNNGYHRIWDCGNTVWTFN